MLEALTLDCAREQERITRFVRRYLAGAGYSRLVVGVSGGIDSSLVASLSVAAVGPENVMGMILPYETSNPKSEAHARLLIEQLGIPFQRFEITKMVQALVDRYPEMGQRRRGNIMARCRMIALYDQSIAFEGLVMGTSNRTEMLLGYFTLHGDGAAALEPIGHLYKCQVRALARHMGVPDVIVSKPPSADLWAGQTDEGDLGFTYDEADQILYLLTEMGLGADDVASRGFDAKVVEAVRHQMRVTAFKRQMPPGLPVGEAAMD